MFSMAFVPGQRVEAERGGARRLRSKPTIHGKYSKETHLLVQFS
jgi:hypothetical protein